MDTTSKPNHTVTDFSHLAEIGPSKKALNRDTAHPPQVSFNMMGNGSVAQISSLLNEMKDPKVQYLLMLALQQNTDAIAALNQMLGPQQYNMLINNYLHTSHAAVAAAAAAAMQMVNNKTNGSMHSLQNQQQMMNQQLQPSAATVAQQFQQFSSSTSASLPMNQCQQHFQAYQYHQTAQANQTTPLPESKLSSLAISSSSMNINSCTSSNSSKNNSSKKRSKSPPTNGENNMDPTNSVLVEPSREYITGNGDSAQVPLQQPQYPSRNLNKDEKQRLLTEATDLTRQLLRINAILDIDTLVLTCDLQKGQVLDRKSNCAELLIAANELVEMDQEKNPIQLASDIFNGKRTIFPRQESNGSVKNDHDANFDPYRNIPTKHEMQRGDILREIASQYTSLYRKSPSNQLLPIKEASIGQLEDLMRNYHKDGYKLSPGIKAYLQSALSDRKSPLDEVIGEESLRSLQPICWDVSNVPYCIKSVVYKVTDRRSSAEAKQRAKDLTIRRKLMKETGGGMLSSAVDKQDELSEGSDEKRQRLMVIPNSISPTNELFTSVAVEEGDDDHSDTSM